MPSTGLNVEYIFMLIIDFVKFCINTCIGKEINENVNSRINVIFVGAFHLEEWMQRNKIFI